jgi:hypothetical protein
VFIRGISVEVPHPYIDAERKDVDAHQVRIPRDWQAYGEQLQKSLDESGGIEISISTTASRGSVAIAIGHMEVVEHTTKALDKRDAFGFIVGLSTLRQLRAAFDAAIASAE